MISSLAPDMRPYTMELMKKQIGDKNNSSRVAFATRNLIASYVILSKLDCCDRKLSIS